MCDNVFLISLNFFYTLVLLFVILVSFVPIIMILLRFQYMYRGSPVPGLGSWVEWSGVGGGGGGVGVAWGGGVARETGPGNGTRNRNQGFIPGLD